MKYGVIVNNFKKTTKEGIKIAHSLGFDGIQFDVTFGDLSPENINDGIKKDYLKILKDYHLEVSALLGDMGGFGYQIEKDNPERVERTKRIIDLCEVFNTKVVTTHIGVIPKDKNEPRYKVMLDALTECGLYAKSKGVVMAIETGPETPETLLQFIEDTKGGVGVNLDPANLVMVTDVDPVAAVYTLKDYIVHTHVKDGVLLKKTDPKIIYDHFAVGGIDGLNHKDYFKETPIGEGNVDFVKYISALKEIGYQGYLTIEREAGNDSIKDISKALKYIKSIVG